MGNDVSAQWKFFGSTCRARVTFRMTGARFRVWARTWANTLAGALLGLALLAPGASWADDVTGKRNPHFDNPSENLAFDFLRIGFPDPARGLAGEIHTCGDSCFSLSPGAARSYPRHQSAYTTRDLSLNIGQSGPVSLRFNGSRLKMHIRF